MNQAPLKKTADHPSEQTAQSRYPKPGVTGGTLIRQVIGFLRSEGVCIASNSHILIATSGGSDSVGLAHLLVHYGRKIVQRSQIKLLHINHGWRGEASDQDEAFVRELGSRWDVPVIVHRLNQETTPNGDSVEEIGRNVRKQIFEQECRKWGATVFTAHQADDLAETVLWRLLTGAAKTHSGGIAVKHENEIRPFLKVPKDEIRTYLTEENQDYRHDESNDCDRFLRARLRKYVMPELKKIFPRAVDHLVDLAMEAQTRQGLDQNLDQDMIVPMVAVLGAAGIKARRPHLTQIGKAKSAGDAWEGEIHLPDGWILSKNRHDRRI